MSFFPTTLAEAASTIEDFQRLSPSQSDSGRSSGVSSGQSTLFKASDAGYSESGVALPAPAVSLTSVAGRVNKLVEDLFTPKSQYDLANKKHPELDLAQYTGKVAFTESNLEAMSKLSKYQGEDLSPSNLGAMSKFFKQEDLKDVGL